MNTQIYVQNKIYGRNDGKSQENGEKIKHRHKTISGTTFREKLSKKKQDDTYTHTHKHTRARHLVS